jgi:hypothetical protein
MQTWFPFGVTYVDKLIDLTGGGTGSATAAGARTNLGLGSMAVQNSSNVTITGGSVSGITLDAGVISSGVVALARGGTGASLALGASGTVLQSNGAAVVFANGALITGLAAGNLASGTVPDGRFPATLPAISGTNLTNLNASAIASGNIPAANMSTGGTWNLSSTFITITTNGLVIGTPTGGHKGVGTVNAQNLFIDGVAVTGGGGGSIPAGLIAIFDTSCPSGWTRFSALDNRFIRGAASYGATGGSNTHSHTVDGPTNSAGSHTHNINSAGTHDHGGSVQSEGIPVDNIDVATNGFAIATVGSDGEHIHSINSDGSHTHSMDADGTHSHTVSLGTSTESNIPDYTAVVFCKKD